MECDGFSCSFTGNCSPGPPRQSHSLRVPVLCSLLATRVPTSVPAFWHWREAPGSGRTGEGLQRVEHVAHDRVRHVTKTVLSSLAFSLMGGTHELW